MSHCIVGVNSIAAVGMRCHKADLSREYTEDVALILQLLYTPLIVLYV